MTLWVISLTSRVMVRPCGSSASPLGSVFQCHQLSLELGVFYYFKRDPAHSRGLQPLFKRAHMPSFKRAPKSLFKRAHKPLFKRAHKPLFKRAHKPLFRRAHKPLFKRAQAFVQEGTHLCSRQLKPLFTHVTACCGTQCVDFVFLLSPQQELGG